LNYLSTFLRYFFYKSYLPTTIGENMTKYMNTNIVPRMLEMMENSER